MVGSGGAPAFAGTPPFTAPIPDDLGPLPAPPHVSRGTVECVGFLVQLLHDRTDDY